jgi:hypothetical protein
MPRVRFPTRYMAGAAHEFATALTQEEMDQILLQRQRSAMAATKAPPKQPPQVPVQQAQASSSPMTPASSHIPPWAPPGQSSAARTAQFPEPEQDSVMMNMLATPPEHAPMIIYDYLLTTAINALLIVASSDHISQRQK